MEEVGLILEHGSTGDGGNEYAQGGKEDTVEKRGRNSRARGRYH